MPRLDLNCDLGEGAGHDAELMPLVTSASIACGAHAGDEPTMRAVVGLALRHGVAVGAHPGFADREQFGRRELTVIPAEVHHLVLAQTQALQAIARACGGTVAHVKPHGALYNMAARDAALARAVAEAVHAADPRLILFGLSGSRLIEAGRARGLRVAQEVFADRRYQPDGSLTPRDAPDALIGDPAEAVAQVRQMVFGDMIVAAGRCAPIVADTVCLHGDGPQSVAFAVRLRAELNAAGIELRAPGA